MSEDKWKVGKVDSAKIWREDQEADEIGEICNAYRKAVSALNDNL